MKNVRLIICLFIFPFAVTAQNQSIDSLKNALKILPQDTVRVNVLNDISTAFIQTGHFDSASRYIKSSVDLVEKLHYQSGSVTVYHNLAVYNFHIKEYKIGKFFLLKSLNAALLTKDKKNIAVDYKELADLYQLQSNFKKAKESNKKYELYKDSLTKEESAKHNTENQPTASLDIKEKPNTIANNVKTIVANDEQKQPILYIAFAVLLILSILIIWLMISRAKTKASKKAFITEENNATEPHETIETPTQLKNVDTINAAFFKKNNKKESLKANFDTENEKTPIENNLPITTIDGKELVDEKSITKADFNENMFLVKNERIEKPAVESAATKIEETNKMEMKPEMEEPVKKEISKVENEANETIVKEADKKAISVITGGHYSNLIFSNQLLHFSAKIIGDTIKLFWKTDDESSMVHFGIEKSMDGAQFVNIEMLPAKGICRNDYDSVDFKPLPGINYFRLKIVDTGNNFIYSPIVQVEVLPVSTLTLICYPTHVEDVIMVTAAGGKLPVLVNIFNKAGKKEFTIETPPTTTPIYLTSLAAGTYTLQMKCQGKTILQQLIKMV